jgi:hypothetical protein
MSTPLNEDLDNDFGYVSPADFDEPGDKEDDIKHKDEVDLPILEEVVHYLDKQIAKTTNTDSLAPTEDTKDMTLEQRWAVQRELGRKLGLIKASITAVIEGIDDKYDETRG